MDRITITVTGPSRSGKTTIIQEIKDALHKAGITGVMVKMRAPGWRKDYTTQGKTLDVLAKNVRDGNLEVWIREEDIPRFNSGDLPVI